MVTGSLGCFSTPGGTKGAFTGGKRCRRTVLTSTVPEVCSHRTYFAISGLGFPPFFRRTYCRGITEWRGLRKSGINECVAISFYGLLSQNVILFPPCLCSSFRVPAIPRSPFPCPPPRFHLQECVLGQVTFKIVSLDLQMGEVSLVKREYIGVGVAPLPSPSPAPHTRGTGDGVRSFLSYMDRDPPRCDSPLFNLFEPLFIPA